MAAAGEYNWRSSLLSRMKQQPRHILIPDSGRELLRLELAMAFAALGLSVSRVDPAALSLHAGHGQKHAEPARQSGKNRTGRNGESPARACESIAAQHPCLVCSVNFAGLSPLRPLLEHVRDLGGDIAVWFVDNPWNVLSGVRDPRWKSLLLFVSDPGFVAPLRATGAERVFFLPLAGCPELFAARRKDSPDRFPAPEDLAPFVFVGRSAFPGKSVFFAKQTVDPDLMARAKLMLRQGERPDLFWWERAMTCDPLRFWPGKNARAPAFGAEESNLVWRRSCLAAAALAGREPGGQGPGSGPGPEQEGQAAPGLDIFGDAAWASMLPAGARLRQPIDYYAQLPAVYRAARYSLALTSLQLPRGLNQRHFDVWLSGGFCLSDATPGLALFPPELTRPVTFARPEDIGPLAATLEKGHARPALLRDWQAHILERHTYRHRALAILARAAGDHSPGII
ncbi:DUF3880 domain-containing protein [Desulfovibrio sp. OttesenSCG-928-A18]|nr:DUF3880 domain-containing protein [Desulfovibrio sp. OttesenSCG-928-A18]